MTDHNGRPGNRPLNEYCDAAGARTILDVRSRSTLSNLEVPVAGHFNNGFVYWIPDVQAIADQRQERRTSRGA